MGIPDGTKLFLWDGFLLRGCRFAALDFLFAGGRSGIVVVIIIFYDVLHDQRDAAVGRVERGVGLAETLVGKAADLSDLVGAHSIGLHDAAGRVGAGGGKVPVAVPRRPRGLAETLVGKAADLSDLVGAHSIGLHDAAGRVGAVGGKFPVAVGGGGVGLGIGVAFDGEFVGEFAQFLGEGDEHVAAIAFQLGAAAVEESATGGFGEFDAEAFGVHRHLDVAFQAFEIRHLLHGLLQLFFQAGHVVVSEDEVLARSGHVGSDFLGVAGGVFEISANGFLNLLAGAEEPENDKERHHGGDEIGVGDLPCAAVVALFIV